MTANRGYIAPKKDKSAIGVHSLDHFTLAVPNLKPAQRFYSDFGLEVREDGNALALRTYSGEQRWGTIVEGPRKKLHHLSFACFPDDLLRLKARAEANKVEVVCPPNGFESNGFWLRDPAGVLIEVRVAPKSSPDRKMAGPWVSSPEGVPGAPTRGKAPMIRPRRLSHVLIFQPDLDRALEFYAQNLGLCLSDRTDAVAFMHAMHGSDHHILAFAQSSAAGFHHCSWDMGSVDEIGIGAARMADKGYTRGWGLGRHVLGSNYFHYVQDPWGSFAEYSADIDYIAARQDWPGGYHDNADSLSLWGPEPPDYFIVNHEAQS
jgi:catechol 2,3-dioxygenase-like lactoylglutathione lyase family enzyme